MPKFAILSDIHSNADALSVVLEKCHTIGIANYISLGDIVGYNAEPCRCIDMVKELNFKAMVIGNHDQYAIEGDVETSGFNPVARHAIEWTRRQLRPEDMDFLRCRYNCIVPGTGITAVHATLDSPDTWGYVFNRSDAAASFAYQFTQLCFCGHSHKPVAFDRSATAFGDAGTNEIPDWNHNRFHPANDTDFNIADELTVPYVKGHKYLFNIGSIGQPRNNDPRASFAVVDTDRCTVSRFRLPYDIASARQKVISAGLPDILAQRLEKGK